MNVLVTGSTGLIGTLLRRALLAQGHRVLAHARRPQPPQVGTEWFIGPGEDPGTYRSAMHETDAVIHLAGASIAQRWTAKTKRAIMASRIETTRALGLALKQAPPRSRVWLNASAVGYYGAHAGEQSCDETAALGEGFLAEVCQAWEAAAEAAHGDARLVLLRFGVVFAAEGGVLPSLVRATKAFLGGPMGSGRQWMSWVHVQDVVRMILWALGDAEVHGAINVAAPNAVRQGDVMAKLAELLHRPAALRLPGAPLRWAMGQMADELLLGGQNVVPRKALAHGYHYAYPTLEAALRNVLHLS